MFLQGVNKGYLQCLLGGTRQFTLPILPQVQTNHVYLLPSSELILLEVASLFGKEQFPCEVCKD
jgi:hypothetical protein